MATTDATQDEAAYRGLKSLRFPLRWVEYLRPMALVVVFGILVAAVPAIAVLAVLTVAPIAASVAGTGGLVAVWLGGIGVVVATPEVATRCVGAIS